MRAPYTLRRNYSLSVRTRFKLHCFRASRGALCTRLSLNPEHVKMRELGRERTLSRGRENGVHPLESLFERRPLSLKPSVHLRFCSLDNDGFNRGSFQPINEWFRVRIRTESHFSCFHPSINRVCLFMLARTKQLGSSFSSSSFYKHTQRIRKNHLQGRKMENGQHSMRLSSKEEEEISMDSSHLMLQPCTLFPLLPPGDQSVQSLPWHNPSPFAVSMLQRDNTSFAHTFPRILVHHALPSRP